MRKHWMFFGALALAASLLAGCGAGTAPSSSAATLPVPDISAQTAPPEMQETIVYTVETQEWEKTELDQDGTLLLTGHHAVPVLHAYLDDGTELTQAADDVQAQALSTVENFNEKFAQWNADAEDFQNLIDAAKEGYGYRKESGQEWLTGYESEFSFTVWQTTHMVSIAGEYYTNTGGAHPNTVQLAWIFDLDDGVFIDPTSLADNSQQFQDAVTEEIVRQADEKAAAEKAEPTTMYWENYQEIAGQWPSYAVSFRDGGDMTVIFSPYEMACYAAGVQEFTISADFMKPYLGIYGRTMLGMAEE